MTYNNTIKKPTSFETMTLVNACRKAGSSFIVTFLNIDTLLYDINEAGLSAAQAAAMTLSELVNLFAEKGVFKFSSAEALYATVKYECNLDIFKNKS